jgi:hypothetical protein
MSGQNFAPHLRRNREGQSIMHLGDFVGNGRAAGVAPKAGWLKTLATMGRRASERAISHDCTCRKQGGRCGLQRCFLLLYL